MKLFKLKSLRLRLYLVAVLGMSTASLPIFFCVKERNIKDAYYKTELAGTKMLSSLAIISHSAYRSGTEQGADAAKLKKAVGTLIELERTLKVSNSSEGKKNPRSQSLFTEGAINTFVKNPETGEILTDLGAYITFQSGLFTDSSPNVHIFMDASSDLFPKIYSEIYKVSAMLKKYSAQPDRSQVNDLTAAYVIIGDKTKELLSEMRRACSLCAPEKSVSIVGDIAKLNAALGDLNSPVSKVWQGKGFDATLSRAYLSSFEQTLSDLWTSSGILLNSFMQTRCDASIRGSKIMIAAIGSIFAAAIILVLFIVGSIVKASRRTLAIASSAANSDLNGARELIENSPRTIEDFWKIDKSLGSIVEKYSEIITASRKIIDAAAQLNADVDNTVAVQKPRINGVSNGLLRADAKINLRDKSDSALSASAQALRDRLSAMEQLARTQNKSVVDVSAELKSALVSASKMISNLEVLRDKTKNMSVVAETFTGVADQANILSLNLAIETAKAGIKGTGLGTLDEQIRILSKRTVVSVIDIESIRDDIIETLESGAVDAEKFLTALESNSKILGEIDESLAELTTALGRISTSANAVSVSLRERGSFDMSMHDAQENLAKVDDALSEFSTFTKNAAVSLERVKETLSAYRI